MNKLKSAVAMVSSFGRLSGGFVSGTTYCKNSEINSSLYLIFSRCLHLSTTRPARYTKRIPEYPDGFEIEPEVFVSNGMVSGKVLEKPDFVKNEVPHPEVDPEVAELLDKSRRLVLDGKTVWPTIKKKRLNYLRVYYKARGYYWPDHYIRNIALIPQKPRRTEKRREARKKLIEEKMEEMPRLIAEYRERVKERRAKKREEKEKTRLLVLDAKRRGINPKFAKAMAHMKDGGKKTKKVPSTKKGYRRKSTAT